MYFLCTCCRHCEITDDVVLVSCVFVICIAVTSFQNHMFVKKTVHKYEKEVNFAEWVCKMVDISENEQ